jgi:hypothetical protein
VGNLKTLVYSAPIENGAILHKCLFMPVKLFTVSPGCFEIVQQSMMWHDHAYIHSGGGHLEHLLRTVT